MIKILEQINLAHIISMIIGMYAAYNNYQILLKKHISEIDPSIAPVLGFGICALTAYIVAHIVYYILLLFR